MSSFRTGRRAWILFFTLVLVATGATASTAPSITNSSLYAAYVILSQDADYNTVGIARVIIGKSNHCTDLNFSWNPSKVVKRNNPNLETFPVHVCEALFQGASSASVTLDQTTLNFPVINLNPENVTVIGDTGCKSGQNCGDPINGWPYGSFAQNIAENPVDLVIHMGDYNYRGTPGSVKVKDKDQQSLKQHVYDAGDNDISQCQSFKGWTYYSQNVSTNDGLTWDSWKNWNEDFFEPSKPLFAKAPWVVSRGNHELCSRGGPGWFYFLDPHSTLVHGKLSGELSCPTQTTGAEKKQWVFTPSYRLDFNNGYSLIVMDSANACDDAVNDYGPFTRNQSLMAGALSLATTSDKPTWLVGHRPFWGVKEKKKKGKIEYSKLNKTLQHYLKRESKNGVLPSSITTLFSGHMHLFETVTFDPKHRPPQIVTGNGGVALAGSAPTEASVKVDSHKANIWGTGQFGYLSIKLGTNGEWEGKMINPLLSQKTLAVCGTRVLTSNKKICEEYRK